MQGVDGSSPFIFTKNKRQFPQGSCRLFFFFKKCFQIRMEGVGCFVLGKALKNISIYCSKAHLSSGGKLAAEQMVADSFNNRAGTNPGIGGFGRIIIIDGSAGGIPSVERVACGVIRGVADRLIKLSVGDGGESPRLINDAGQRIREGRVLNAIKNHGSHSYLSGIVFAACFC